MIRGQKSGEDKHVLVKVQLSDSPLAKEVFEKESSLYGSFCHDHLIRKEFSKRINFGYRIGRKDCIVLEYIDGVDLEVLINHLSITKRKIPERVAIDIAIKVLSALNEVHKLKDDDGQPLNIVHADVSPHNILLSRTGQVKLIDFGIPLAQHERSNGQDQIVAGKASYMAPEQKAGHKIDQRTDLYAMGIVLAENGTFAARSDDFVSYTIPGYADKKMSPFDMTLPEGVYRVIVKGFDEKDKQFTLSKSVTIGPNKTTRCIAYVQSEKRRVECE